MNIPVPLELTVLVFPPTTTTSGLSKPVIVTVTGQTVCAVVEKLIVPIGAAALTTLTLLILGIALLTPSVTLYVT